MKKTTISIGEDIKEFIKSKKVHPRESNDETLRRLLKFKNSERGFKNE